MTKRYLQDIYDDDDDDSPLTTKLWNKRQCKEKEIIQTKCEWLPIKEYVDVEINKEGIIRKISNQEILNSKNLTVKLQPINGGAKVSRGPQKIKLSLFPPANLENEEWRAIESFPTYQVSSKGRIRNSDGLIIKAQLCRKYCRITLHGNKTFHVHTLVAHAFLPKPRPDQNTVNHKNGIPDDNDVENLEWNSKSEQSLHAHANGLINNTRVFRSVHQIEGQTIIATFKSIVEAARATGIPANSIGAVCSGRRQTTQGFRFMYAGKSIKSVTTEEQNKYDWVSVECAPSFEICREGIVRNATTHKILVPQNIDNTYIKINLWTNGKKLFRPLHILLAKAFLPNPDNLPVVHHINEIKTDNDLDNLQWTTQRENAEASMAKAVFEYDTNNNMKLTRSWVSASRASVDLGISRKRIQTYVTTSKVHNGFLYSYDGTLECSLDFVDVDNFVDVSDDLVSL